MWCPLLSRARPWRSLAISQGAEEFGFALVPTEYRQPLEVDPGVREAPGNAGNRARLIGRRRDERFPFDKGVLPRAQDLASRRRVVQDQHGRTLGADAAGANRSEVETSRCQGLQKPRQRSKLIGSWTTNCCADTRVASLSPRYGLAQPSELPVRTGALSPPTRTRAWNPSRGGWFLPLKP
jgi:hypothetical protein